jgi:hypothetical protein
MKEEVDLGTCLQGALSYRSLVFSELRKFGP